MGTQDVQQQQSGQAQRTFMRQLLNDLRALEQMLADGVFETGVRRIGAEQELFLVQKNWRPAPKAIDLLEKLDRAFYTTELGLFNLEINLTPHVFGTDCLHKVEDELNERIELLRGVAEAQEVEIALTGILPTLLKSDLELNNMTPLPRYRALNRALTKLRGGAYDFHIKGLDELNTKHNSVMLESCNASFQVHFQVAPDEFANLYNVAQFIAAPVLAAAVNSPLLFGLRLWRETRIALFQQAVDTRGTMHHVRETRPRVFFGDRWVQSSVLELYQEDVTRFRTLIAGESNENALELVKEGKIPELQALRLHNGTVYRWNRACYGMTNGKPHLRIENRVLPSGPSVIDEVANAAFWFGLMSSLSHRYDDISKAMDFGETKMNFLAAARLGIQSQFTWLGGRNWPADKLILDELLPAAEEGLRRKGIDEADIERYLGVIEKRVERQKTGSAWALHSLATMGGHRNATEKMNAIVAAMISRQKEGTPVAEWEPAKLEESGGWKHTFLRVEQFMSTDFFSVNEDDPVDLVANLMRWERIRHVLVEDHRDRLVGVVSYRALLRLMAEGWSAHSENTVPVSQIMKRDPICVTPETSALRAIEIMQEFKIGMLPVVKKDHLVGFISERDFMDVAAELLASKLKE